MALWRKQALADLPELRESIESTPTVMRLWLDLWDRLRTAYGARPIDEDSIRRIYRHALWTLKESPGGEARTAVLVAFFEHLPTDGGVRADLFRWIDPEAFHALRPSFGYFLSPAELVVLEAEYRKRRAAWLSQAG